MIRGNDFSLVIFFLKVIILNGKNFIHQEIHSYESLCMNENTFQRFPKKNELKTEPFRFDSTEMDINEYFDFFEKKIDFNGMF